MRLPVETRFRHARGIALALILAPALAGCAAGGSGGLSAAAPLPANGPAADYPVVVGEPYQVGETLYTPEDTLNFDEVGLAAADAGHGITASHHTMPLPSYAEVTSLDSGRTILVRLERRGPMNGHALIALSPAALAQLGAEAGAAVRVRRVNPPEEERAFLRAGEAAPLRMDTPEALLTVLRRNVPQPAALAPAALASVEVPPSAAAPVVVESQAEPQQAPVQAAGAFVVQAVALSSQNRAQSVAEAIGGSVSQAGRFYRVRTGPFATRSEAEASLAKVRAAGYSEARIFISG